MALDVEEGLRLLGPNLEVVGFDGGDEIFIWRLDSRFGVLVGEQTLVHRDEAVCIALAQLHRCLLRRNLADGHPTRIPVVSLTRIVAI